ncbi:MAG: molecular chaperone HtpG [Coriobacteriales bacterium]|jgi:molecular chaperone HtpG|nr:molecular chaperone HtpG [Coriobacteriales bacterium]
MKKFKTESRRLLDLMINSIYTNREIFLRELISNASDAVNKLYLASLTDPSIEFVRSELGVELSFDSTARTITVSDNGIGMDKESLSKNLGTIAHSDSLEFRESLVSGSAGGSAGIETDAGAGAKADANKNGSVEKDDSSTNDDSSASEAVASPLSSDPIDIIGQFGVGFYSSFMVASKVRVVSRAYGNDEAWAWESTGIEGYDITPAKRDGHGTDVILTLKPDTEEEKYSAFLGEHELQRLVKKYSNYVRYPVRMEVTKSRPLAQTKDTSDGASVDATDTDDATPTDADVEYEDYQEMETLNSMTPIWKRAKADVSDDEYAEFYRSDFHDYMAPAATFTLRAEGTLSYDALLFIPAHAPHDLYSKDFEKGLALYSANVLIMEKCGELLSDHFNFVRGVVDSADLNLNISRETLQHNSQLRAIAKRIEKKIVSELGTIRDEDRERYEGIFECFGHGIKYGIYASYGSLTSTLADLLLYHSAKEQKMVTLREYLDAAPTDQQAIYYAAGDDEALLAKMPMVRSVRERGYDVLLCTQDVDDFCMSIMATYDEKPLKNVASSDLGLETEEEKQQIESLASEGEGLFAAMQEALGEKVAKVTVSTRLADVAAGISAEGPISLEMERVLSAGPEGKFPRTQRVLELNPNHAVFAALTAAQADGDTEKIGRYATILYNQALLVEGLPVDDPIAYAQAVSDLMG